MSKPERSAQQREPLDLGGLVVSLREWADKIEGDPSGIVAFFLRFAFAEAAMVEHVGAPGRTLLVEGAGGGQTWVLATGSRRPTPTRATRTTPAAASRHHSDRRRHHRRGRNHRGSAAVAGEDRRSLRAVGAF